MARVPGHVAVTFQALVLAGSRPGVDPLAAYAGIADKAMIVVGGQTMLARVIAALRAAGAARIVVSASAEVVRAHAVELGAEVMDTAEGPSASVGMAFDRIGAPLLVTTADHALLQGEWIAQFLADIPPRGDVAVLLARRERIERDAGATARTYLRFADGAWSGCNLFYLATPRAADAIRLWRRVERDRKRPWRIVFRLGPVLLLRYLTRRLTLASALAFIGAKAGVRAAMVESRFGLAAVDVDKPADLDLARRLTPAAPRQHP
uniref:nucleotidyltransferase family protein n=1 Tax=uncultured Sphingomonas sp. TaxID=158754 RepID=UPI0035CA1317